MSSSADTEAEYTTFSIFGDFGSPFCKPGFFVPADEYPDLKVPDFCNIWVAEEESDNEYEWKTPPSSPKPKSFGLPPPPTTVKPTLPPPETKVGSKESPILLPNKVNSFADLITEVDSEDSSDESIVQESDTDSLSIEESQPLNSPPPIASLPPPLEEFQPPKPKQKKRRRLIEKHDEDEFSPPKRKKKKLNPPKVKPPKTKKQNKAKSQKPKKKLSKTSKKQMEEEIIEEDKDHKGKVRVLKHQKTASRVKKRNVKVSALKPKKLKASTLKAKPKKVSDISTHPISAQLRENNALTPESLLEIGISDDIMGYKRPERQKRKVTSKVPTIASKPPVANAKSPAITPKAPSVTSKSPPAETKDDKTKPPGTRKFPRILKSIPRRRVTTSKDKGLLNIVNSLKIPKKTKTKAPANPQQHENIQQKSIWPMSPATKSKQKQQQHIQQQKPRVKIKKPVVQTVYQSSKDPRLEKLVKIKTIQCKHVSDPRRKGVRKIPIQAPKDGKNPLQRVHVRKEKHKKAHPNSILKKRNDSKRDPKRGKVRFLHEDTSVTWSPESSPRGAPDPSSRKPIPRSWEEHQKNPHHLAKTNDPKKTLRTHIEKQLKERGCWTCVNILEASVRVLLKGEKFMEFLHSYCLEFVEFDQTFMLVRYIPEHRRGKKVKKPKQRKKDVSVWYCLLQRRTDVFQSREFSGEILKSLQFGQLVNVQERVTDYVELGQPDAGFCKPFDSIETGLTRRNPVTDTYESRELMARSDLLGISIFKPTDKITGHWLGADDGKDDQIWLDENDKGVITGYVNDPKKSHIEGKRTGQKISIQILYNSKTTVNIKAKLSRDRQSMMMNFVCVYENGRTVEGTNEIKKQPLGKLSGVWEGGVGKETHFYFRHYECGLLTGHQYRESWCKIAGTVKNDKFILKQTYGKDSWADEGEVSMVRGLIISDNVLEVSYAMVLHGQLVTGTNVLKRKR